MNNLQKAVKRIVEKCGGVFTEESSISEHIKIVASDYPEILAAELESITKTAIQAWENYNNQIVSRDLSDKRYNLVDDIILPLNMTTDRGVGLYPIYEVMINERIYTEYTPLNALRRYNNYWNNND